MRAVELQVVLGNGRSASRLIPCTCGHQVKCDDCDETGQKEAQEFLSNTFLNGRLR